MFLTADAVGTTTVPEVTVGTAQGDVTYARYRLGTSPTVGLAAAATPCSRTGFHISNNAWWIAGTAGSAAGAANCRQRS